MLEVSQQTVTWLQIAFGMGIGILTLSMPLILNTKQLHETDRFLVETTCMFLGILTLGVSLYMAGTQFIRVVP